MSEQIKSDGADAVHAAEDQWNARERERAVASETYRIAQRAAQEARARLSLAKLAIAGYADMPTIRLREQIADLAREHAQAASEGHSWAMVDETWRPFRSALSELARRVERSGRGVVGTLAMMGDGAAREYAESQTTPEGCGELVLVLPREAIQALGQLGLLLGPVYVGPVPVGRPVNA